MEEFELVEKSLNQPTQVGRTVSSENLHPNTNNTVALQEGSSNCSCGSNKTVSENGAAEISFIYAVGQLGVRFPNLAIEKEFAQAAGRSETNGLTDKQVIHAVLSSRANRYLVRQLCWVLSVEGIETYIVVPRDPQDYDLLIDAMRANPSRLDIDVVIGIRGPLASPQVCNGLVLPGLIVDQVYSFDRESLIKAIPRPEKISEKQEKEFRIAAGELFDRIVQIADNAGATDEHRALNYLAVRYPTIYAFATDAHARNFSLTSVSVRPSRLSGIRKIVDVIFTFTNRTTDVIEQHFVRVDVTEEFPFLVTKLSPYYER